MLPGFTPPADWLIVVPVLLPLFAAALLLALGGRAVRPVAVALAAAVVVCICVAFLLCRVLAEGPLAMTMGRWLPPFGISFAVDVTGAMLTLTAAFATLIVLVCLAADPPDPHRRAGFFALLLVLLAGVDGAFLTGDLFNLYVWFEVMLIASFGLLVVSGTALSVDAAVKYGLVNFIATSLFLAALALLYGALGTLNMADIIGAAQKADPPVMTSVAALLLVAFGTKAAAFPANGWLPASYHAPPAAISAVLGGLLTKVAVYALLRTVVQLLPASGHVLQPATAVVAGATLLLAPLGVLAETNLRRAVGYLLIGGIGTALVGVALPVATGAAGAVAYIVTAMLAITALYIVAGLIERRSGETDIRRMGGFYAASAPLSVLFLLLVLTLAGVPPLLGFWPKLLLLQAAVDGGATEGGGTLGAALAACLLLNALLTLLAGARLWSLVFLRPAQQAPGQPASAALTRAGLGPAMLLTAVVVAGGLWPEPLLALARAAAASLLDPRAYVAAVGLGATP